MKSAAQEKHPRIRGESYFDKLLERSDIGNIPAYAGKAPHVHRGVTGNRKHPRIRGESTGDNGRGSYISETSPHTRGKPFNSGYLVPFYGNIPAYAGKAQPQGAQRSTTEKHPRIRGESVPDPPVAERIGETSPHTRGKPCGLVKAVLIFRNIPAYAGKAANLGSSALSA